MTRKDFAYLLVTMAALLAFGVILYYGASSPAMAIVTGVALIGSFMVSYARARAEGLRFDCQVGLMERPERLILLIVVLLIGGRVLAGGLLVLAVLSMWTFLEGGSIGRRGSSPVSIS